MAIGRPQTIHLCHRIACQAKLLPFQALDMANEQELTTATLTIRVNVDGLPLSRSFSMQLRPILGQLVELPKVSAGPCKSIKDCESVQDYLKDRYCIHARCIYL